MTIEEYEKLPRPPMERTFSDLRNGRDYATYYYKEDADRYIRKMKWKRCMAMAERCKFRMYYLSTVVDYEASKLRPNPTAVKRYSEKESRMDYWKNIWLTLAEKFKPEGK